MEGKIMSNFNEESIITRIEELLKQRNWSIYKLAQEAGISYPTLSNALNHKNIPTFTTLSQICEAFNISLSDFFSYQRTTKDEFLYLWELMDKNTQQQIITYMKGAAHLPL